MRQEYLDKFSLSIRVTWPPGTVFGTLWAISLCVIPLGILLLLIRIFGSSLADESFRPGTGPL